MTVKVDFTYTLHLSQEEASILRAIVGSLCGLGRGKKLANELYHALHFVESDPNIMIKGFHSGEVKVCDV
jgi:hypothetical protein